MEILLICFGIVVSLISACDGKNMQIIEGEDVDPPGKYPWMVAYQDKYGEHKCGATLIGYNWVLTAAHCTEGTDPPTVIIVLGLYDYTLTEGQPEEYSIVEYIQHPGYFFPINDIVLIRLDRPANVSNSFIDFATIAGPDSGDLVGEECQSVGWGREVPFGEAANVLQEVTMDVISNDRCEVYVDAVYGEDSFVTDGELCVVEKPERDSGTCQGDSGSPLNCPLADGSWLVVGALSWGMDADCPTALPQGYTRISHFYDWIINITGELPGNPEY